MKELKKMEEAAQRGEIYNPDEKSETSTVSNVANNNEAETSILKNQLNGFTSKYMS